MLFIDKKNYFQMFIWIFFICGMTFIVLPVNAQISADYSAGGGIKLGTSTTTCDANAKGAVKYNTVDDIVEFCDGSNWRSVAGASPLADCSPDAFSFGDLSNQSLSSLIVSEVIPITGIDSGCVVTVSGSGSPELSVNGSVWGSSATINPGDELQIRQISSSSVSTVGVATVIIGASADDWTVTTRSGSLLVFKTSAVYAGSELGGLSGADGICQRNAGALGYTGTYKAILSDEATNAKDRLTLSYPIVRASGGATVSLNDLWIGSLNGSISSGAVAVWTGTNSNGTKTAGNTCDSWTGGSSAYYGSDNQTTGNWTAAGTLSCAGGRYLYCIQQ